MMQLPLSKFIYDDHLKYMNYQYPDWQFEPMDGVLHYKGNLWLQFAEHANRRVLWVRILPEIRWGDGNLMIAYDLTEIDELS